MKAFGAFVKNVGRDCFENRPTNGNPVAWAGWFACSCLKGVYFLMLLAVFAAIIILTFITAPILELRKRASGR